MLFMTEKLFFCAFFFFFFFLLYKNHELEGKKNTFFAKHKSTYQKENFKGFQKAVTRLPHQILSKKSEGKSPPHKKKYIYIFCYF
jgi:hypothetical protein